MIASIAIAVPATMNYQAKVTDIDGEPIDGAHDITFRIYEVETGPGVIWTETHYGVGIVDGFFSVRLGTEGSPLDIPFNMQYWLEIIIGTDVLAPREPLSTSAYSFNSANAESLCNYNICDWAFFADSLTNYFDARGYPIDSLLAWSIMRDSIRTILWNDGIGEVNILDWTLVLNEFYDRSWTSDSIILLLDKFDFIQHIADTFYAETGWTEDSIWYYYEMLDSLMNLNIPDLIEFVRTTNGIAMLFDGDTVGHIWYDDPSGAFMASFNGDTAVLEAVEIDDGYAILFDGDTLAYAAYDDATKSIAIWAFGDTLVYLDVNVDMDGASFEYNGDTLYYADFSNPVTAVSAVWMGLALGILDLESIPTGYSILYEGDTLAWMTVDNWQALVYTDSDTLFDLNVVAIPNGRAFLYNDDTLAYAKYETTGPNDYEFIIWAFGDTIASIDPYRLTSSDGVGIIYNGDTIGYVRYDDVTSSVAVWALGDTLAYFDVNTTIDGTSFELDGDTLYYVDFHDPWALAGVIPVGLGLGYMDRVDIPDGYAVLYNADTLLWATWQGYQGQIYTPWDTLTSLEFAILPDGRAMIFNGDTLATLKLDNAGDFTYMTFNEDTFVTLEFLYDSIGVGLWYDVSLNQDTMFYMYWDSLLYNMLGFTDLDSFVESWIDSIDIDSILTWHFDSLCNEYPLDTLKTLWDNTDIGWVAQGDSAGIVGLGGMVGGWFEGDSAGIYATNTGATGLAAYLDGDVYVSGKMYVDGLVDPTGFGYTPQAVNPLPAGMPGTWVDDGPGHLHYYDGTTDIVLSGGGGAETDPLSVHLTGDQSVAGEKTFTDPMTINGADLHIYPVDHDEAIWIESYPSTVPTTTTWLVNSSYSDPGLIALGENRIDGGFNFTDPSAGYAATYGSIIDAFGVPHLIGGLGGISPIYKAAVFGLCMDDVDYAGYFIGDVHIDGGFTVDSIYNPESDTLWIENKLWVQELITDTIEANPGMEVFFHSPVRGGEANFYGISTAYITPYGSATCVDFTSRISVDTIFNVHGDTLWLDDKVWMEELVTDTIESRGDFVFVKDAFGIQDSFFFDGAWRTTWGAGGSYIENQFAAAQSPADFWIDGDGTIEGTATFGAAPVPPTYLLQEGFEGTFLPTGWTEYGAGDPAGWQLSTTSSHSGSNSAFHDDDNVANRCIDYIVSPELNCTGAAGLSLTFWDDMYYASFYDSGYVVVSTASATGPWTLLWNAGGIDRDWGTQINIDLSAYDGESQLWIAWVYEGDYAYRWYIDDVELGYGGGGGCGLLTISCGSISADGFGDFGDDLSTGGNLGVGVDLTVYGDAYLYGDLDVSSYSYFWDDAEFDADLFVENYLVVEGGWGSGIVLDDDTIYTWDDITIRLDTINAVDHDTVVVSEALKVMGELIADSIQAVEDTIFLDDHILVDGCGLFRSSSGGSSTTLYTEGFESGDPPTGWAEADVVTCGDLYYQGSTSHPSGYSPTEGATLVRFDAYNCNGGEIQLEQTTSFSTSGFTNIQVGFDMLHDTGYSSNDDRVTLRYSTDGTIWNDVQTYSRYDGTTGWATETATLPTGAENQANLYLAFYFISAYGNDVHIDNLVVNSVDPGTISEVEICGGDVTADNDIEGGTFTLNGATITDWPEVGKKLDVDTLFNSDNDTLWIKDKLWTLEVITDTIESEGDVVFIKDALGVRDSFFFDGAWRTSWPAGGGADADWTISGSDMYSAVSGYVGIGTTTPGAKLNIIAHNTDKAILVNTDGTNRAVDIISSNAASVSSALYINNAGSGAGLDAGNSGTGPAIAGWSSGTGDLFELVRWEDPIWVTKFIVLNNGNVGIGETSPSSALDVDGDIEVDASNAFYFGDPTTDGTWRIIRSGTNLVFQLREGGAWVTKNTMSP